MVARATNPYNGVTLKLMSSGVTVNGILVVGTDDSCGKTVATAGLALAMQESGFKVQVFKPLSFKPSVDGRVDFDQAFFNHLTQQYLPSEQLLAPNAWEVQVPQWNRMREQLYQLQYPAFIEAPGQVGTPWRIHQGQVLDATDFAKELGLSVLVVSELGSACFAKTRVALEYLRERGIDPIGFMTVGTQPQTLEPNWEQEPLLLSRIAQVPFLGDLPYSPSIQVKNGQQGNLLRLTEEHIDLLPLQLGMGITLG